MKVAAEALGRALQSMSQIMNDTGKRMRESALQLQTAMNEFDRHVKRAMKDDGPDDEVGAEK